MEACNSHKCHCTRCMAARDVKALIDLNHRIDQRIAMRERDQLRRDAWKRRAAQHHIDRAGVCCAPYALCSCPNCVEFRTCRPGEFYQPRAGRIFTNVVGGRKLKWTWARYAGRHGKGWRRRNIDTGMFFGPLLLRQEGKVHHIRTRTVGGASIRDEVIIHETNPNSADNWVRAMFTDPPAYVSREQAERYCNSRIRAAAMAGATVPEMVFGEPLDIPRLISPEVRAAFLSGDWSGKKEHHVTPLQLAILAELQAHPSHSYFLCGSEIDDAISGLLQSEMLARRPQCPRRYELTDRAKVFFRAIHELPLPVRQPAPWTMPS